MTSPEAIRANTANAAFSTGPRTPEGKRRSSQNAAKHRFSSDQVVIGDGDQETFDSLHDTCHDEFEPASDSETILVDKIAIARWNMRRIEKAEAKYHRDNPDAGLDVKTHPQLEVFRRYSIAAEGSFFRCLRELRSLQAARYSIAQNVEDIPNLVKAPTPSHRQLMADLRALVDGPLPGWGSVGTEKSPERNEPNSEVKPPDLISRSGPCPCKSGQKYKRCCGRNAPPKPGGPS
jgi:hypothetical protein